MGNTCEMVTREGEGTVAPLKGAFFSTVLLVISILCAFTFFTVEAADPPPPFNTTELATLTRYFLANIDISNSGAVVASPDHNTPGGNYYYHWARDAALSMHTLQVISGTDVVARYGTQFSHYIKWVLRMQATDDSANGVDVRVEAKFEIPSGQPYPGPWCRPQTDGPGLRAITLIHYADALEAAGHGAAVNASLWTGNASLNGGAIAHDLAWVVENWASKGCDLWEELHGDDFFWGRLTMHRALTLGAAFARAHGDPKSADQYTTTAAAIAATLSTHYDGNFVSETDARRKDAAVICAFNDGYTPDGPFAPAEAEVAGTVATYNDLFHAAFPINADDDSRGVPGILYGRYEGDTYGGGNPWILSTACLAQVYYRAAVQVRTSGARPSSKALSAWGRALKASPASDPGDFARQLAAAGDGVLTRIHYHTAGGGLHQPEQLDKKTGYESSATDLTWSYATVLKAMTARAEFYEGVEAAVSSANLYYY